MKVNSRCYAGFFIPLLKLLALTLTIYPYNIYVDNGNHLH